VDNYGFVYNLLGFKGTGKEAHAGVPTVGKEHRQITGVVAVGLVGWVPMVAGGLEGIPGIADAAAAALVDMKAVGTDGLVALVGRPVGGKAADFNPDPGAAGNIVEKDKAIDLGPQGAAPKPGQGGRLFSWKTARGTGGEGKHSSHCPHL